MGTLKNNNTSVNQVQAANWSTEREYSWDGAGYSSIYAPATCYQLWQQRSFKIFFEGGLLPWHPGIGSFKALKDWFFGSRHFHHPGRSKDVLPGSGDWGQQPGKKHAVCAEYAGIKYHRMPGICGVVLPETTFDPINVEQITSTQVDSLYM